MKTKATDYAITLTLFALTSILLIAGASLSLTVMLYQRSKTLFRRRYYNPFSFTSRHVSLHF